MAMAKRLFGALVPVLCTVACGQTVVPSGAVEDAGAVPLADAGFDGGVTLDAGAPADAGTSVLDDPNLAPFDSTLLSGPKDWVSGSGPVLLEVGISGPSVGVPPFSITRSPITNREFAQCVRAGACRVDLVSDKNCRDTTVFRDANYEVLNHLAWIFRNTTLKRALWDAPATCLKYEQAEKYCAWIGAQLPTVPQFVFAARGTYGEPVRRYPWGNTRATCAESANPSGWNSSENLVVNCCGKHCDDPSLYEVGTHPAGASPMGMQDVLMTPFEMLRRGSAAYARPNLPCAVKGFSVNAFGEQIDTPADMHRVFESGCFDDPQALNASGGTFRCVR